MKKELRLTVNGEPYELMIKPKTLLIDVLRNELELIGTKRGCDSSSCGACTILIDGNAVRACSVLAMQANDKQVTTIEGLAEGGKLHPVQESFLSHGALQCGFCTTGMIMSAKALFDENPKPTEEEIRRAIVGNLCRCTGYAHILDALKAVAQK